MESSSDQAVSGMPRSGSSSSLSELEEDWEENIAPTQQRKDRPPANRLPDKKEHSYPETRGELVTDCIDGKNYILPFVYVDECLKKKRAETCHRSHSKDRFPTEGLMKLDSQRQHKIVNQLFEPVEYVLLKKNLCGDFSVEKCKDPKRKSDTRSTESQKRNYGRLDHANTFSSMSAKELKIDRTPFQCPISSCEDFVCAAYFSSHLKVEHNRILMEAIVSGQPRSILVDPSLNRTGKNLCNIVYYMVTKLRDFGISEFKNTVPVLLMSSKFRFAELEVDSSHSVPAGQPHYMFWITGIASESLKIRYSLEIGSHHRQSGWILPLGLSHDLRSVYQSGTGMILSQARVDQLTRRKDKLLEMRIELS